MTNSLPPAMGDAMLFNGMDGMGQQSYANAMGQGSMGGMGPGPVIGGAVSPTNNSMKGSFVAPVAGMGTPGMYAVGQGSMVGMGGQVPVPDAMMMQPMSGPGSPMAMTNPLFMSPASPQYGSGGAVGMQQQQQGGMMMMQQPQQPQQQGGAMMMQQQPQQQQGGVMMQQQQQPQQQGGAMMQQQPQQGGAVMMQQQPAG